MIREKISSKSPNNKLQQPLNNMSKQNENQITLKLSAEKKSFPISRDNNYQNSNGVVRIEKSIKRVDSLSSFSQTPTSLKKNDLLKSISNSSKDQNDLSDQVQTQNKSIQSSLNQNSMQKSGQNITNIQIPSYLSSQNKSQVYQLKDIDLNTAQNKRNLKLNAMPQIGVFAQSFIQGDSQRNQNLRDGTDRSNKTLNMAGISVSITNKEFQFLNDFVSGEDWRKITKLELCQNRLQQFPNEIWDLIELRSLKLDNNYIKTIPEWAFDKLSELKDFSIQNNLVKAIPPNISKSQQLLTLDFSLNHIDSLPNELFDLPNLTSLSIVSNDFDSIPSSFVKVENQLKEFSIDWFRYANPPMNIKQSESVISLLIAAIKKDIQNVQKQKSQVDVQKGKDQIYENNNNNNNNNNQYSFSSSLRTINQGSSTNFTLCQDGGSSFSNLNFDYSKYSFSLLKFVRTFSKVFDLSRVVSAESGGTLVHQAVYNEDIGALLSLLNYDQPQFINAIDKHLHSPLSLAIKEEQYYCAKILIYRGADVNIGSGFSGASCLLIAVNKLQFYLVKDLIDRGANINHIDKDKNNCMHTLFKIFDNNPKEASRIGELLLDNGAHPNLFNSGRWTPLHIAARKGNIHAIKFALEYNKKHKKEIEKQNMNNENSNTNTPKNEGQNIHKNLQENNSPKDQNEAKRILFKIYQRGGEEKMNILHISSQNCYTDIVELLILQENYNFTKRNGFDRNAYSLSQRHSTISKILKRSEVRMLDCFISQDIMKVLESKMYDCQDDDLAQINPYQKSKAYNFYDQINQNNRLSALNSSFQNQRLVTEDRASSFYGRNNDLMSQSTTNQSKIQQQNQLSMFSFLKQSNQNQPYFNAEPRTNNPFLFDNKNETLTLGYNSTNNQLQDGNSNLYSSLISKDSLNTKDYNLNSPNFYSSSNQGTLITQNNIVPQELMTMKKSDSFHQTKNTTTKINPTSLSNQSNSSPQHYLELSSVDGQHYMGSFLIQNSLEAFKKSREDFQKFQNKLYPIRPLPQHQQNKNYNILDSFSNDNLNSDSLLNASDELAMVKNTFPKSQQNEQSKYQQQRLFHSEQTLNQKNQVKNIHSSNQISTDKTNFILPITQPFQQQCKIKQEQKSRNGQLTEDQDSIIDLISEESGVKSSQILSWSKLQPKLIQDKLEEERKNYLESGQNSSKRQQQEVDSMEESSMKQQVGDNNPKIFSKAQQYNQHVRSNIPRPSKFSEMQLDTQRIREILEFSLNESNSSEEQNMDEHYENIEESLNESFTRRIMPYSPNNLKHIHPSFFQPNANNLESSQNSASRFQLTINTTPQPIKLKKNYPDPLHNVFKSNLSSLCNNIVSDSKSMPQENEQEQINDIHSSISLNEQSWNKHCYKMKTQKRVDQYLEQLKYLELKLKNQDLILSKRLESLNAIKEIEGQLKGILKELISNHSLKEANQYDLISIQQYISSAITQFNLTINQIYFYFYNLNQQSKIQVDYFRKISNATLNEIKLEKDWVHKQRHYAQEKIHDNKTLHTLFQQQFPQNNIVALRQQLGFQAHSNTPISKAQTLQLNSASASFISNSKFNSSPSSSQILINQQPIQLSQQYDQIQMSTNPLLYFENVQRLQLHSLNPQSRTHILNETQLMQTLPTEEEYDQHQIEQPSIKFTQYNLQKPKGSDLHKRLSDQK